MPKISIIVPVYNVEKYLNRCIDSILTQTFSDFELILVDDGSPDNCDKICDEYKEKDNRIRVVHKKNGGLSSARNAGLKIATGEFVTFIDSDDYVKDIYLEKLLHENMDFVIQTAVYQNEDGSKIGLSHNDNNACIYDDINSELVKKLFENNRLVLIVGKIYRRKIITDNSLYFDESVKFGEETLFNAKFLQYSKNLAVENESNYCYIKYINRNTLTDKMDYYDISITVDWFRKICSVYSKKKEEFEREFAAHIEYLYKRKFYDDIVFLRLKDYKKFVNLICQLQHDKDFLLCLKYDDLITILNPIKKSILSKSKIRVIVKYTYLQVKQCIKEFIKK